MYSRCVGASPFGQPMVRSCVPHSYFCACLFSAAIHLSSCLTAKTPFSTLRRPAFSWKPKTQGVVLRADHLLVVGPDEVENLEVVRHRLLALLLEGVVVVDVNAFGAGPAKQASSPG